MKYDLVEYIDHCKVSINLPLVSKLGELDLENNNVIGYNNDQSGLSSIIRKNPIKPKKS